MTVDDDMSKQVEEIERLWKPKTTVSKRYTTNDHAFSKAAPLDPIQEVIAGSGAISTIHFTPNGQKMYHI